MNSKITKKDVTIMIIMTVIYLVIALINLGNFESPQTGWEPQEVGESFVVDFGREVSIDKIMLFSGLGHAWGCFGSFEIEANINGEFEEYSYIDMKSIFKWYYTLDTVTTDKLRFTAQYLRTDNEKDKNRYYKVECREIGFFSGDNLIEDFNILFEPSSTGIEYLFDEQHLVPDRPNVLNSSYFDEVYFPRTALEQLEKRDILYENTHPPLGKTILSLGIRIFGMTPFGWRIMGTLCGAAIIPLMYLIAKRFFKDSFWAFFCAFLMMFDFMHFVQTRLGTVDSYLLFFIMLMYYFMLDYYDSDSYENGFFKSLIPLLLCGIALGLAASVKWIGLYGAFGLAVLFFLSRGYEFIRYRKQDLRGWAGKYFWLTGIFCVFFFIIIPFAIYVLSFIPINYNNAEENLIKTVIDSFKHMFEYHKNVTAVHPYQSSWYEWPLNLRPIFYYQGVLLPEKWGASIACLGHPLLFWTGFIAFLILIWSVIRSIFTKKNFIGDNKLVLFPIISYLSLYLPWAIAPRKITFIYHYFACIPFLILMVGLLFRYLEEKKIISRKFTKVFLIVFLVLFILFYPLLSGLDVPRLHLLLLQWLPRWEW